MFISSKQLKLTAITLVSMLESIDNVLASNKQYFNYIFKLKTSLAEQSVPITTKVVIKNPARGEMYSIQTM